MFLRCCDRRSSAYSWRVLSSNDITAKWDASQNQSPTIQSSPNASLMPRAKRKPMKRKRVRIVHSKQLSPSLLGKPRREMAHKRPN